MGSGNISSDYARLCSVRNKQEICCAGSAATLLEARAPSCLHFPRAARAPKTGRLFDELRRSAAPFLNTFSTFNPAYGYSHRLFSFMRPDLHDLGHSLPYFRPFSRLPPRLGSAMFLLPFVARCSRPGFFPSSFVFVFGRLDLLGWAAKQAHACPPYRWFVLAMRSKAKKALSNVYKYVWHILLNKLKRLASISPLSNLNTNYKPITSIEVNTQFC